MLDYFVDYLKCWKNISGKMDRHSYWAGLLTILVIVAVLLWFGNNVAVLKPLPIIFTLLMIIPYLSATIRRLHDVGRKSWFVVLLIIPVIGWICIFVETIQSSKNDEKQRKDIIKVSRMPEERLPARL